MNRPYRRINRIMPRATVICVACFVVAYVTAYFGYTIAEYSRPGRDAYATVITAG